MFIIEEVLEVKDVFYICSFVEPSVGLNTRNDVDKNVKNNRVRNWLLEKDVNKDIAVAKG